MKPKKVTAPYHTYSPFLGVASKVHTGRGFFVPPPPLPPLVLSLRGREHRFLTSLVAPRTAKVLVKNDA